MISPGDLKAGRLLAGMTLADLAKAAGVSRYTVHLVEAGEVWPKAQAAISQALGLAGVKFMGYGRVHHHDGRVAPLATSIGRLTGKRIRRARWRLGWKVRDLAAAADVVDSTVRRLEAAKAPDVDSAVVYRIVGALQLAGTIFAPGRHDNYSGDRCLVPRPRVTDPATGRPLVDFKPGAVDRRRGRRTLDVEDVGA